MTSAPAGWYPDPLVPSTLRYWDGYAWTSHQQAAVSPFAAPLTAPPGTAWNTPWIWLVVLLPLLPLLLTLFIPWGSMFAFDPYETDPTEIMRSQMGLYTSPLLWLSQLVSYAVYGLCVFFAYLDQKELKARAIPKTFHWAWAFLNPVYPIGRSVVVKRRTGHGSAPMWAAVASIALSLVVATIIAVTIFAGLAELMQEIARVPA
ncbi:hypothetical protein ASD56_07660 [Microbacterium sp. Root166]|uniref:DUF2510 domain-containing protein n=1 Tax=Microbacterium sp. Root166 TaxID=1736478 RepID=UPI0006F2F732|nr:DUF2510 domain-containing protein [Microbacterium sp. Root166]KQZ86128.1 hypothetical protein ASD56_07660 [Microbacterium sp. Root166]